jgi:tetratricopeptide (TPR) repeat protein
MRHWQLATDVDPKAYITMSNLALGLLQGGEKDCALAMIDKAFEQGDEPQMHDTRSRVYLRFDRTADALKELEIAMAGMPDNWRLREQAAEACERLNRKDDARKYLAEAGRMRAAQVAAAQKEAAQQGDKPLVAPAKTDKGAEKGAAPEKGKT